MTGGKWLNVKKKVRSQSYGGATGASAGTIKGNRRRRIYNALMFNPEYEAMTPGSLRPCSDLPDLIREAPKMH